MTPSRCTVKPLALAMLLPALAFLPAPARGEILEEIAARVNDAIITRSQIQNRRDQIARQFSEQFEGTEYESRLRVAQDSLLFDMINEELLLQQAKLNFDMERYWENVRDEFMRQNKVTNPAELQRLIEQEGLTEDEFRRLLLRSNVPQDVLQFEVARRISVSDAEVAEYYEAHAGEFQEAGEVSIREIVILDKDRGPEAARALADGLVARARAGEDFGALARELSEAPSKDKDGLVGPYRRGDLAPLLEKEAFTLPEGGTSDPIGTSYGLHVIQVVKRSEARRLALADVKTEIEGKIRQKKYQEGLNEFLGRLWSGNQIQVNPRYAIGKLADGGPFAERDKLVPEGQALGPPATPPAAPAAPPAAPPPAP